MKIFTFNISPRFTFHFSLSILLHRPEAGCTCAGEEPTQKTRSAELLAKHFTNKREHDTRFGNNNSQFTVRCNADQKRVCLTVRAPADALVCCRNRGREWEKGWRLVGGAVQRRPTWRGCRKLNVALTSLCVSANKCGGCRPNTTATDFFVVRWQTTTRA